MLENLKNEKFINFIKTFTIVGLLLLIFASILILNFSTLVSPDDYNYSFVLGGAPRDKVNSLKDCIDTGKFLYMNWTGRILPHVLVGLFRNINHYVFEIVNSFVFMVFIITLNKVLNKKVTFLGLITAFGYLVFSKMFGEKFAWISGSLNYLWPSTCLALFICAMYNFTFEYDDAEDHMWEEDPTKFRQVKNTKYGIVFKIVMVLFAFITAFTHENIAFVGGSFLLCLYLSNFKKIFEKDKLFYILVFIMFCLGAAATIFAPGNLNRMGQEQTAFSWGFLGNFGLSKKLIITVIVSTIIIGFMKEFKLLKREIILFLLPIVIATIPMAVISYFPPRAFLPYEALFIIILVKNVTMIAQKVENHKPYLNILVGICSIVLTLVVFRRYSPSTLAQIKYIIPYKYKVTAQLEEAKKRGDNEAIVSDFRYLDWIHREDGINIDNFFFDWNCTMPINSMASMYYGFDRITAIGDDEYLIRLKIKSDHLSPYFVIDRTTGIQTRMMEFIDQIEFPVPKSDYGKQVLNCKVNDVEDELIDYEVRYIGGQMPKEEIKVDDLIEK